MGFHKHSWDDKMTFLSILAMHGFNISKACRAFNNLRRSSFQYWMDNDAEFKERYNELNEYRFDTAEESLFHLIKGVPKKTDKDGSVLTWHIKPDRKAIEFFLRTKGGHRGYTEKREITGKDGESLFPRLSELDQENLINEYIEKRERETVEGEVTILPATTEKRTPRE